MKIFLILILSLFIQCGVSDSNRIVEVDVIQSPQKTIKALYDTKLQSYCQWSDDAGVKLSSVRCIPYFGNIYYVDNICTIGLIGLPMDFLDKVPKYMTADGRFYEVKSTRSIILTVKPFYKDQNGNCIPMISVDFPMFKDISRELSFEEFGVKHE